MKKNNNNSEDDTILTPALERRPTRTPKLALVVQLKSSDLRAAAEVANVAHEVHRVVVSQSVTAGEEEI
ncbi:hypothetical protein E2C01_045326 [Portunus trituberculatus]|uniref:Uncharacterized protein n=1 Tax=Portunus trituberculatus TaxID=210409 RepID=A0A5B7FUN9_PORTR|nr:hypothetical protein [Portunus trituberculatus]